MTMVIPQPRMIVGMLLFRMLVRLLDFRKTGDMKDTAAHRTTMTRTSESSRLLSNFFIEPFPPCCS